MTRRNAGALFRIVLSSVIPILAAPNAFAQHLPAPWQHTDVGNVGLAGDATQGSDGDYFVSGAGSDIWGSADSFHFMYRPIDDGDVAADNPQQDGKHPFAKIGIMIRMSLDPGSPHVILDAKPDGTVEFMTRSTQDGPTTFIASSPHSGWLWLVRRNGTVTAVVCGFNPDGCTAIGSAAFPSGPALAGGVVTSHDPSTLNHGFFQAGQLLIWSPPQQWSSSDIGNVGLGGSATLRDGTFTVKGAGADIWGTADAYHFVGTLGANGDGEVVARVTSEKAANTFAKAGVIMASASGRNQTVVLDIRPNGVIEFMARPVAGGPMEFLAGSASSLPVWLKLVRRGDQFSGFMSSDGREWQTVGVTTVSGVGPFMTAGLAVTSHDASALNTSTFDHVMVASQRGFGSDDIGDVGISGLFGSADGGTTFVEQGGGGDIWGTADAFHYSYQSLMDDGQMVVRVNSLDNTQPFAKAGLMIRESLDPSAAHVLLDVTPSGLIELLTRESTGAETRWIGGLSPTPFPVWLKIVRSGTRIMASVSADGSTWQDIGTAFNTQLPSDALIGVAVTSHHRGVVTTANVSNISR